MFTIAIDMQGIVLICNISSLCDTNVQWPWVTCSKGDMVIS